MSSRRRNMGRKDRINTDQSRKPQGYAQWYSKNGK